MRRRRKTKYTWLPPFAHPISDAAASQTYLNQFVLDLPPSGDNQPVVGITPVLYDISGPIGVEGSQADPAYVTTLSDLVGSEYFIKRIVGKVFLDVNYDNGTGAAIPIASLPAVTVAAGFLIAREDPSNLDVPIQYNIANNYSGFEPANQRQPWLWQRQWMLGPGYALPGELSVGNSSGSSVIPNNAVVGGNQSWPLNNYTGSVLDGPHLDAKTARRVRQDERLFFQASLYTATPGIDVTDIAVQVNVRVYARVLGALRRAKGKSAF